MDLANFAKVAQDKGKFLQLIESRGPVLPADVAKAMKIDSMFAGAILSELLSHKQIKHSNEPGRPSQHSKKTPQSNSSRTTKTRPKKTTPQTIHINSHRNRFTPRKNENSKNSKINPKSSARDLPRAHFLFF